MFMANNKTDISGKGFVQLLSASALMLGAVSAFAAEPVGSQVNFTAAQADAGQQVYAEQCASCHGFNLEGFGLVPSLSGSYFSGRWGDADAGSLMREVRRMPPSADNSLPAAAYGNVLAYILQHNGIAPSTTAMANDVASLTGMTIPVAQLQVQRAATQEPLIYNTEGPLFPSALLDNLSLVTDAMLQNPPEHDWLNWRRTRDSNGHSPLAQINTGNVENLQMAWSWSLPSGENMMLPIVHDGVMFAYSYGDVLQALDATTGDLLWGYQRHLDGDTPPDSKKGVAIYGDMIVMPTSDMHLIALNMKTGQVVWDHKVDIGDEDGHWFKSAPLIANGKAIIGLTGRQAVEGGNFILAVDMATGQEVWRFWTIARPEEPGGDTWNGLPLNERTGGSVWIPGSFDEELNLVYFGAAPTYDTERLRQLPNNNLNNDALYTNSTIALNADTGELAWHFQHAANDQLDHDWAFERTLVKIPVNGVMRKAVVTGGKQAIFEAMDAATGEYLFSMDLDMQNVIAEINPDTGAKTLFQAAIPAFDAKISRYTIPGICPDWLGARNMQSTAFNPATGVLFIPMSDTCMLDDTGKHWQKYPDPDLDDSFGIVQALDLRNREVLWTTRQHGPQAAANLTTDGGLLFIGSVDRWFKALDQSTGEVLWEKRLDNAVNSYPITYRVNGKQYVAVATNTGGIHTRTMRAAADITIPETGATMWVFALPD